MSINDMPNLDENNDHIDLSIAIDFSASPLIFVDNNFCIRYVNFKGLQFFRSYEEELKNGFPYFSANDLLGKFFGYAYEYLKTHLDKINQLNIGEFFAVYFPLKDHFFELKCTPILNTKGVRTGTCFEFIDYQSIMTGKKLLSNVINLASQGDFSNRIDRDTIQEHTMFKEIFTEINQLFSTINNFFGDIAYVLDRISSGDLTQSFEVLEHEGDDFTGFKRDTNYAIEKLKGLFANIKEASEQIQTNVHDVSKSQEDIKTTIESYHREMNKMQFNLGGFFHDLKDNHQNIQKLNVLIKELSHSIDNVIPKEKPENNTNINDLTQEINSLRNILDITENLFKTYLTMLQKGLDFAKSGNASQGFNMISEANQSLSNKAFRGLNQLREFILKIEQAVKTISTSNNAQAEETQALEHIKQAHSKLHTIVDRIVDNFPDENAIQEQTKIMLETMTQSKAKATTVVDTTAESLSQLKETSANLAQSIQQFKFESDIDADKLNREINF